MEIKLRCNPKFRRREEGKYIVYTERLSHPGLCGPRADIFRVNKKMPKIVEKFDHGPYNRPNLVKDDKNWKRVPGLTHQKFKDSVFQKFFKDNYFEFDKLYRSRTKKLVKKPYWSVKQYMKMEELDMKKMAYPIFVKMLRPAKHYMRDFYFLEE